MKQSTNEFKNARSTGKKTFYGIFDEFKPAQFWINSLNPTKCKILVFALALVWLMPYSYAKK